MVALAKRCPGPMASVRILDSGCGVHKESILVATLLSLVYYAKSPIDGVYLRIEDL